jgi:hypothetical protein
MFQSLSCTARFRQGRLSRHQLGVCFGPGLRFGIAFIGTCEHADPPHSLLLRARRKGQRACRACDELVDANARLGASRWVR